MIICIVNNQSEIDGSQAMYTGTGYLIDNNQAVCMYPCNIIYTNYYSVTAGQYNITTS